MSITLIPSEELRHSQKRWQRENSTRWGINNGTWSWRKILNG
jgi:hypothetical protein